MGGLRVRCVSDAWEGGLQRAWGLAWLVVFMCWRRCGGCASLGLRVFAPEPGQAVWLRACGPLCSPLGSCPRENVAGLLGIN